jgi:hypothetical protein
VIRVRALAALTALAAASVTACSSTPPPRQVLLTKVIPGYLRGHPVPQVPGMISGIVTEQLGDVGWLCHQGHGSMAGNCGYWAGILQTAAGQTITFTCGQVLEPNRSTALPPPARAACTDPSYMPEPGDYVYVPSRLVVTADHPVRVIRLQAIQIWDSGPPATVLQPAGRPS